MPSGPIRVLRVLPTLGAGGTERQCLETAVAINKDASKAGVEAQITVDIVTLFGPPDVHTLPVPDGLKVVHLNCQRSTLRPGAPAPAVRKLYPGYDVIHAMLWPAAWAVSFSDPTIPWLASIHGSQMRTDPLGIKRWMDRRVFSRASRVVFNSDAGRDILAGYFAIPAADALVIRNAKAAYHGATGQRSGIACVARYLAPKRQDILLDALALLDPQDRPHVSFYGLGTDSPELNAAMAERGLAEYTTAAGEIDEPIDAILESKLLALPSDHEGMPNVVLEAWAAGTPVLASDVSGIRDLVRHGKDGWLVRNDPGEWAIAITELLKDNQLRGSLAANGLQRLKRDYSMENCVREWCNLYASIANRA